MKKITLSLLLSLLFCVGAGAQFTAPAGVPADRGVANIINSVSLDSVTVVNLPVEFRTTARLLAERRARIKERNTFEFNAGLQASQTQFENWAAGGDNTFSGRATLFMRHLYEYKKFSVETKFEGRYGLNYIEDAAFKNEDEFKLGVVTGWKMAGNWSYAASANLRSQFTQGFLSREDRTRVSAFMAPGFLDMAVGFKYDKAPVSVVLSPLGGNAVFVMDDRLAEKGLNGMKAGRHSRWEVGPSVQVNLDYTFYKEVFRIRSYLYAFVDYSMDKDPIARWETTFDIMATKFLTTTFYAFVNYDSESAAQRPTALQYKYAFAVGLAYTFKNK